VTTRVFLDANVLFSAAWRPASGLTCLWQLPELFLVTSAYAADEAERNLARKRPEAVARLHALMRDVEIANMLVPLDDGHGLPPKDVPILAGAGSHRRANRASAALANVTTRRHGRGATAGLDRGDVAVAWLAGPAERRRGYVSA
jgi:hypothetical protein